MRYKLPLAALLAAVVAWRWRARAPPPDLTELEAGARVGWVAAFDADTSGALSPDELARLKASMDLDLDGIELMIEHLLREHTHNVMRAVNLKLSAPGTLRAINRHTRALFVVDRLRLTLTDIATSATSAAARRKHLGMLRVRKLAVARIADDAVELGLQLRLEEPLMVTVAGPRRGRGRREADAGRLGSDGAGGAAGMDTDRAGAGWL